MDVRVGPQRRLSTEELMLLNCDAGEGLIIPWTARRSNQPIVKEINPEYSLEGLMLKLKLQYFDHLMERDNSLYKTLMLGKIQSKRRMGWQRMRWLDGITDSMDMSLSTLGESEEQGSLACCNPWIHKGLDMTYLGTQQQQLVLSLRLL